MKTPLAAACLLALAGPAHAQQTTPLQPLNQPAPASPQEPAKKRPHIYDEQARAAEQIDAALARAAKENRRVLIQWGANWCGWCYLLHDTFSKDADVKKKLAYEYDLVLVDVGRFNKNTELAERYKADIRSGIPYLTILDGSGQVLANQETGSLEVKGEGAQGHDAPKVLEFLSKHQAPYAAAEALLTDALGKAKSQNKLVFLHFGAPWCGWCKRLEAWMAGPEVGPILAKDFIDLKIDEDRTTGGKELQSRFNTTRGGIPWFVFLDASGNPVADSNGPEGNIGFPAKEDEIAHFVGMLTKARRNLTDSDIQTLKASLEKK
jgi:thiol:disulfide interchange protein